MKTLSCLLILFVFGSEKAFSQYDFRIAYGERIAIDGNEIPYDFKIVKDSDDTLLHGEAIREYVFKTPGLYTIFCSESRAHVTNDHKCAAISLPKEIKVYVDNVKISFFESSLRSSKPIRKKVNQRGNSLLIEVVVDHYHKRNVIMPIEEVRSAGIGTSLVASLDISQKSLTPGRHTLVYHLSGSSEYASYVQFDFVDAQKRFVPIGLKNKIEE